MDTTNHERRRPPRRLLALGVAALLAAALALSAWSAAAGGGAGAAPVDFWNYDPATGEKIWDFSPGVAPGELAALYAPAADAGLGAARAGVDPTGPHGEVDFWNYDPVTGEKTSNVSPGVAPGEVAALYGGGR